MEDWADRHVARWRDHWIGIEFDDDTEAIFIRMGRLTRHLHTESRTAISSTGLEEHEYNTLHQLMIRDTPGTASPTQLAQDLGISGAGMTGRLDSMERSGWIKRSTIPDDRRRVQIEVTTAGAKIWRQAMGLRGAAEEHLVEALSPRERATLTRLLKKLTERAGDP